VVVLTSAVESMISCDTVTVLAQRGSVPPETGQLLPGAAEVTVSVRMKSPVSGLSTVTE
jgi:hypothetical protein